MLPYDGEPVQAPSTSAWQWAPAYGLYFNALTRQWAKPKPDGTWEYADGVQEEDGGATERGAAEQMGRANQADEERSADKEDPAKEEAHGGDERGAREGQGRQLLQYDDDGPVLDAVPPEQVWPGSDDDDAPAPPDPLAKAPLLRLVVDKRPDSTVLPPAQCVASIDPGEPVSIGRDKSFERRIRLRELAVSKAHCTLFWALDPETEDGGYWAVVDNASTHGTFLSSDRGDREIRLSEPKVASVPHRLHHFDTLRAGSTTFRVHIHASFACSACSVASDSSNLIPLVATPSEDKSSAKPTFLTKTKEQKEQDRREQMAGLRAKLLKPSPTTSASSSSSSSNGTTAPSPAKSDSKASHPPAKPAFIDRAAARRQRDAGSSSASPAPRRAPPASAAASAAAAPSPFFTVPGATASSSAASARATPVDPFAHDSRGAKLLSKLGGSGAGPDVPGARGGSGAGLGTLVEARTYGIGGGGRAGAGGGGGGEARPGLGSKPLIVGVEQLGGGGGGGPAGEKRDWRDEGRERSWKRFREGA